MSSFSIGPLQFTKRMWISLLADGVVQMFYFDKEEYNQSSLASFVFDWKLCIQPSSPETDLRRRKPFPSTSERRLKKRFTNILSAFFQTGCELFLTQSAETFPYCKTSWIILCPETWLIFSSPATSWIVVCWFYCISRSTSALTWGLFAMWDRSKRLASENYNTSLLNFLYHSYTWRRDSRVPVLSLHFAKNISAFSPSQPKKWIIVRCSSLVHDSKGAIILPNEVLFTKWPMCLCTHTSSEWWHNIFVLQLSAIRFRFFNRKIKIILDLQSRKNLVN